MHKCEKVYWILMPAIKRELAKILAEKYKLRKKDIAKMLKVTNAAVSQYLKKKRGSRIRLSKKAKEILQKTAEKLIRKNSSALDSAVCKICKEVFA
ncbi:MAG: hypothetical protein DRO04_01965 [Candidatus Iainarchaeum archaeon]|uniref:Transcriptional regulator n=1 Tax=Candidatus Iainarchaeum sp. TaxID=3101447 RepID=A0A497JIH2_9ARCH|nr:MAG: hypothetical protein DRO04_01965 [Candidatus Diapherotrites archaeon]